MRTGRGPVRRRPRTPPARRAGRRGSGAQPEPATDAAAGDVRSGHTRSQSSAPETLRSRHGEGKAVRRRLRPDGGGPVSLQIETHHEERSLVLRCDTCAVTHSVRTLGPRFPGDVETFFAEHADCTRTVELPGS